MSIELLRVKQKEQAELSEKIASGKDFLKLVKSGPAKIISDLVSGGINQTTKDDICDINVSQITSTAQEIRNIFLDFTEKRTETELANYLRTEGVDVQDQSEEELKDLVKTKVSNLNDEYINKLKDTGKTLSVHQKIDELCHYIRDPNYQRPPTRLELAELKEQHKQLTKDISQLSEQIEKKSAEERVEIKTQLKAEKKAKQKAQEVSEQEQSKERAALLSDLHDTIFSFEEEGGLLDKDQEFPLEKIAFNDPDIIDRISALQNKIIKQDLSLARVLDLVNAEGDPRVQRKSMIENIIKGFFNRGDNKQLPPVAELLATHEQFLPEHIVHQNTQRLEQTFEQFRQEQEQTREPETKSKAESKPKEKKAKTSKPVTTSIPLPKADEIIKSLTEQKACLLPSKSITQIAKMMRGLTEKSPVVEFDTIFDSFIDKNISFSDHLHTQLGLQIDKDTWDKTWTKYNRKQKLAILQQSVNCLPEQKESKSKTKSKSKPETLVTPTGRELKEVKKPQSPPKRTFKALIPKSPKSSEFITDLEKTYKKINIGGRWGGMIPIPHIWTALQAKGYTDKKAFDKQLIELEKARSWELQIASDRNIVDNPELGIDNPIRGLIYFLVKR